MRAVLERNLLSTILVCQRVARDMMERRRGRILLLRLDRGVPGPRARRDLRDGQGGRGAVHALLGRAAAPLRGYRQYAGARRHAHGPFLNTRAVPEERLVEAGTLERIATVDEVARVVEFFAGPLGAFVSGQVLRVDGGTQCWPG